MREIIPASLEYPSNQWPVEECGEQEPVAEIKVSIFDRAASIFIEQMDEMHGKPFPATIQLTREQGRVLADILNRWLGHA